jgi:hypothetical protein
MKTSERALTPRPMDIKRKIRLLKVYVPATSTTFLPFFLLLPLTVLKKQTRQTVCTVKQSALPRCLRPDRNLARNKFVHKLRTLPTKLKASLTLLIFFAALVSTSQFSFSILLWRWRRCRRVKKPLAKACSFTMADFIC